MDSYLYGELLKSLDKKRENIENIAMPKNIEIRLKEIQELESKQDFWDDAKIAGEIQKEKINLEKTLNKYKLITKSINDAKDLFELATAEQDLETLELLFLESSELESNIKKMEIEFMLNDEFDGNNAIISITAGAGGTESQDWGSILYRMYLRWSERRGFKTELLDYQEGEEAGIKGVSFIIKGENAYGYMKAENGVHRLVRISPFDSNAKRHTSFTSVMVSPELDDDINIVIEEKDLRIDTYRASGAGGQHVNKTDSAIRITHIPSGIVVQCQNDRSQHKNRANAIKMLKGKLYEMEKAKQKADIDSVEKSENSWGHQIRSYVLAPYQQVKDTRSNIAYSQVDNILDGDIDEIIEGVLVAISVENQQG